RIVVPSGGMGALDLLGSAAIDRLDAVRLTTRKPPRALLPPAEAEAVMAAGAARPLFDGPTPGAGARLPGNPDTRPAPAAARSGATPPGGPPATPTGLRPGAPWARSGCRCGTPHPRPIRGGDGSSR